MKTSAENISCMSVCRSIPKVCNLMISNKLIYLFPWRKLWIWPSFFICFPWNAMLCVKFGWKTNKTKEIYLLYQIILLILLKPCSAFSQSLWCYFQPLNKLFHQTLKTFWVKLWINWRCLSSISFLSRSVREKLETNFGITRRIIYFISCHSLEKTSEWRNNSHFSFNLRALRGNAQNRSCIFSDA